MGLAIDDECTLGQSIYKEEKARHGGSKLMCVLLAVYCTHFRTDASGLALQHGWKLG